MLAELALHLENSPGHERLAEAQRGLGELRLAQIAAEQAVAPAPEALNPVLRLAGISSTRGHALVATALARAIELEPTRREAWRAYVGPGHVAMLRAQQEVLACIGDPALSLPRLDAAGTRRLFGRSAAIEHTGGSMQGTSFGAMFEALRQRPLRSMFLTVVDRTTVVADAALATVRARLPNQETARLWRWPNASTASLGDATLQDLRRLEALARDVRARLAYFVEGTAARLGDFEPAPRAARAI